MLRNEGDVAFVRHIQCSYSALTRDDAGVAPARSGGETFG